MNPCDNYMLTCTREKLTTAKARTKGDKLCSSRIAHKRAGLHDALRLQRGFFPRFFNSYYFYFVLFCFIITVQLTLKSLRLDWLHKMFIFIFKSYLQLVWCVDNVIINTLFS